MFVNLKFLQEWLWPVGFYLRAYLKFYTLTGKKVEAVRHIRQVISKHWAYLQASPWKGLPELTNKNGAECWGSCRVQAWSMATLLEVRQYYYSIIALGFQTLGLVTCLQFLITNVFVGVEGCI